MAMIFTFTKGPKQVNSVELAILQLVIFPTRLKANLFLFVYANPDVGSEIFYCGSFSF